MPTEEGLLSLEEHDAVRKWLTERGATRPCPSCGNEQWSVGDRLALLSTWAPNGPFVIGAGYPVVVLVCSRCTFMRTHSAISIGIVKPDMQEGSDKKTEAAHGR